MPAKIAKGANGPVTAETLKYQRDVPADLEHDSKRLLHTADMRVE